MIRIEHGFSQEIITAIKAEYRGNKLPDIDMFGRNDAFSEITIEEGFIREIIKNEEGIFKDVITPFSDLDKFVIKKEFAFVEAKEFVYCISLKDFVEGDFETLKELLTKEIKQAEVVSFKKLKKEKQKKNKEYYKEIKKNNYKGQRVPLAVRFRIPLITGLALIFFRLIDGIDPLYGDLFNGVVANDFAISIIFSGLSGFALGIEYIFVSSWFRNLSDKQQILAIVLFPITLSAFFLISVLGTIPYVISLLVLGYETPRLDRIINVAAKIAIGIVVIVLILLVILF